MLRPIRTPHIYLPELPVILGYSLDLEVFLKDESQQLGRSVKGRVAYAMAKRSRESGRQIVESSSGTSRWGWDIGAAKLGAASCRGGGRDFDPQRAAASVAERRVVDRACGEHEDQVPLGEEGDGVTRP